MSEKHSATTTTGYKDTIAIVQERLKELGNPQSIEALKQLFWTDLDYSRANEPLSSRNWPEKIQQALYQEDDPLLLFATGGKDDDFEVIYIHLASNELLLGDERPIVMKLLEDHLDALFIFSNAAQVRWHFVNVKFDSTQARRRLFRRITVGPEERLRTASERISMLDIAPLTQASRFDIIQLYEKAFDVEAVTRKFFDEYKIRFRILQIDLKTQTHDNVWAHDYALQFLNRCMFLYFIQRKGWLGGDREFLRSFWDAYHNSSHAKDTFFENWLQVLFFEAFNNKFHGGHTHFPPRIHHILATAPYLNGGLFSQSRLDTAGHSFIIADSSFEQIFRFFESYNFTIAEDSPLDQEVAVDPEMIGRVYESLVNVSTELDERSDAGIFYTPRTEIDLMCRLSLVDYLANHIGQDKKSLLYDAVFALEPEEKSSADDALRALKLWDPLHGLLREVTVVDPACGSGAFLVGMLYVLDDLQERAEKNSNSKERESPYERKKRIIGQSLYGVDVMEWAAHIAELRLWLTLVIDVEIPYEDLHVRRDPLLPHLTFKIRYGDSLVQEIGDLNFGYMQATTGISPILKRRLSTLKAEKVKFYHHDPSCIYKTREAAIQEEQNLFRTIIQERRSTLEKDLLNLRNRPDQPELLSAPGIQKTTAEDAERQKQIIEKESEMQELDKVLAALVSPKNVPFVWDIAFVEIFGGNNDGFDIVIGNPPYVRQEEISDPRLPRSDVEPDNKRAYKRKLANTVYHDFPDFFQYKPGTGKVGHEINAKSDLYIFFYLHGLRLLNSQGSFCFITSNSWLDVGYGADLQEFLLSYDRIKLILDNQAKRSFATADVNTVIVLLSAPTRKPDPLTLNNIARFVMFKVGFEQVLTADVFKHIIRAQERANTPVYRVHPIAQKTLLEEGFAKPDSDEQEDTPRKNNGKTTAKSLLKETQETYTGNKWGGKYLRAPDIYWTIMEKGKGKLVRLGDIAEVRFGIKTGANEFFFLDDTKARQWKIEEEFLQPAIKNSRESKSILIDPNALKSRLFLCHKTKEEIKGSAALEYIMWGESQAFHKRPSCASRPRWWDLGVRRSPYLGFNYLIDSTAKTLYAPEGCYFSDNFQEVDVPFQSVLPLCASLNSTVFQLMVNVAGRSNFGDGLLKIQTYEVSDLLCLHPSAIDFNNSDIFSSTSWDVLSPSSDRRVLDNIVFDALNLSQRERDALYEAVIELVEARLNKAKSLKETQERNKRLNAVEKTAGIWLGLPEVEETGEYA